MLLRHASSALLLIPALTFLIPQLKTNDNAYHCPEGLSASSWTIFTYTGGLSVSDDNKLAVSAVVAHNHSQFVVLKYCESEKLALPFGGYCVFKGNSSCPSAFRQQNLNLYLLKNYHQSSRDNNETISLCCGTPISPQITMPKTLTPPYALVKYGKRCQNIRHTKHSDLVLFHDGIPLLEFCYYEMDIRCTNCQQTCDRYDFGGICSCFQGYKLINNSHCQGFDYCGDMNGGCDHYCHFEDNRVRCSCQPGYYLYDNSICLPLTDKGSSGVSGYYKVGYVTSNENKTRDDLPLFSHPRDYILVVASAGGMFLLLFLLFLLLLFLDCLKLTPRCLCPNACSTFTCSKPSRASPSSSIKYPPPPPKRTPSVVNRNSISAPCGNVAVDLLNRPKQTATELHDLPATVNRASYYSGSHRETESIYDSLDRRQRNQVVLEQQESVQYDEPEEHQPLVNPSTTDHYCEPDYDDELPPETPLPEYSPTGAGGGIYNFSETYRDPATRFSVGKLGKRQSQVSENGGIAATVARIAPTRRVLEDTHSENLKENSVT